MKIIILLILSTFYFGYAQDIKFYTVNKQSNELVLVSNSNDYEVLGELDFLDGSSIAMDVHPKNNLIYILKGNGEIYTVNPKNLESNFISKLNNPNIEIKGSWRGITFNFNGDMFTFNEESGSAQGRLYKVLDVNSGMFDYKTAYKSGSPSILGIEFDNDNRLWTIEQCCNHRLNVFNGFTGQLLNIHNKAVSINYPEDLAYFENEDILIGIDIKNEYTADITDFFFADRKTGETEIFVTLEGNYSGVAEFNSFLSIEKEEIAYNVSIFPNPTSDKVSIKSDKLITGIKIYSMSGYIVYETNNNLTSLDIDISEYTSGVYILEYEINNNLFLKKIVKN